MLNPLNEIKTEGKTKRPLALTFVALFQIVAGGFGLYAILLGVIAIVKSDSPEISQNIRGMIVSAITLSLIFSAILASGIGIFKQKVWGWQIAVTYYIYSVLSNMIALTGVKKSIQALSKEAIEKMGPTPVETLTQKLIIQMFISIFIVALFYFKPTRDYFEIDRARLKKLRTLQIIISSAFALIVWVANIY